MSINFVPSFKEKKSMSPVKQKGLTLLSFIMTLAVAGAILYFIVILFPMYEQYYTVRSAAKSMVNDPQVARVGDDPDAVKTLFYKRLDINSIDSLNGNNVHITRAGGEWHINVSYEDRRHLCFNLDIVGVFNLDQDLTQK